MHALVIALFIILTLHGSRPEWSIPVGHAAGWLCVVPMTLVALVVEAILRIQAAKIDRDGSWRHIQVAERALGTSRWAVVALHTLNVFGLGLVERLQTGLAPWLGAGPLVELLAQLIALTLPIAVIIAGWWSFYPIERRLRESVLLRGLDQGHPIYPLPSRLAWVGMNIRHQLLLSLLPLTLIISWSALAQVLVHAAMNHAGIPGWVGKLGTWLKSGGSENGRSTGTLLLVQIAGAGIIFVGVPLLMAKVWDTIRLAPGQVRERLIAMCQDEHVKVRELLVWRTYGTMVNGAVMGLIAPIRYILLTDALLDQLPARQVEAVMAHELAHVKRAHLPWLAAALIAAVGLVALAFDLVVMAAGPWTPSAMDGMEALVNVTALAAGIWAFGFVSRRFEWQADAFAVQHLSKRDAQAEPWLPVRVSPEAVADMAGALEAVARLNHMPRIKPSWRHGSIQHRQERLTAISGLEIDQLPIDRTVRRMKWLALATIVLVIGAETWTSLSANQSAPVPDDHPTVRALPQAQGLEPSDRTDP